MTDDRDEGVWPDEAEFGEAQRSDWHGTRLDSVKLRCLAHPLRSRLLTALRLEGPATSTTLADRLATNTGATSYHLRRLADAGLVEEIIGRGTGRERWWQSAHSFTSWSESQFDDDPTDRAAAEWLTDHHAHLMAQWRDDWLATRHEYSRSWRGAADVTDYQLDLTPEQLHALNNDLLAVLDSYRISGPAGTRDVQRVVVLIESFPATTLRL